MVVAGTDPELEVNLAGPLIFGKQAQPDEAGFGGQWAVRSQGETEGGES